MVVEVLVERIIHHPSAIIQVAHPHQAEVHPSVVEIAHREIPVHQIFIWDLINKH